jgi:hypothetical protein
MRAHDAMKDGVLRAAWTIGGRELGHACAFAASMPSEIVEKTRFRGGPGQGEPSYRRRTGGIVMSKTKKPAAPKGDVRVPVDPKLKKAYDALVATIEEATHREAVDFYARWGAAADVVNHSPPLYTLGGYATANDFYEKVMEENPRNAQRYVRVVGFTKSGDDEAFGGVAKLDALLGFIEAKIGHPLVHPPLPVALDHLRIPVNGATKRAKDATVAEVRAATAKLTKSWHKKPKTPAQTAVMAAMGKIDSLKDVQAHEHAGLMTFTNVPIAAMSRFVRALSSTKL